MVIRALSVYRNSISIRTNTIQTMMMMMAKKTTTTTTTIAMASPTLSEINAVSSEPTKQYSSRMGEERHLVRQEFEQQQQQQQH